MERLKLGQKVTITITGATGEVIGIHDARGCETQYNVEYADKNFNVQTAWLPIGSLKAE